MTASSDEVPSFMQGVEQATSGKPFLGNGEVVHGLLQQMVKAAYEPAPAAITAVQKTARIFAGRDPAYAPQGAWNGQMLADWCRDHMNGLAAHPDPAVVIGDALAHLVHQLRLTATAGTPKTQKVRVDALMHNWTLMMLGIESDRAVPKHDAPDPDEPEGEEELDLRQPGVDQDDEDEAETPP
jgi:hypothetical protein